MKKLYVLPAALITAIFFAACGNRVDTLTSNETVTESMEIEKTASVNINTDEAGKFDADSNASTGSNISTSIVKAGEKIIFSSEKFGVDEFIHVNSTTTRKHYYDEEQEKTLAYSEYELINLTDRASGDYPELSFSVSDFMKKYAKNCEEKYENLVEYSKDHKSGDEIPITYDSKSMPVRTDGKVFSVRLNEKIEGLEDEENATRCLCVNFDSANGDKLKLSDVVIDTDAFADTVFEALGKINMDGKLDIPDSARIKKLLMDESEYCQWLYDYSGISIFFMPAAIPEAKEMIVHITIGICEYPELFNPDYVAVPEKYIQELNPYETYYIDINQDGKLDTFRPSYIEEYAEWGMYSIGWKFNINGKENKIPSSKGEYMQQYYDARFYYVKNGDDGYIYTFNSAENGYIIFAAFYLDCDKGKAVCIENTGRNYDEQLVLDYSYDNNEDFGCYMNLTDPDNMCFGQRTYILGTYDVYRWYNVGEDGLPESNDKWYEADNSMMADERKLILKRNMEFTTCDNQGNKIGNETFSKGSRFRIMRINDADQVMICCEDNAAICILELYTEGYTKKCEGVSIEDLFDNMLFAG